MFSLLRIFQKYRRKHQRLINRLLASLDILDFGSDLFYLLPLWIDGTKPYYVFLVLPAVVSVVACIYYRFQFEKSLDGNVETQKIMWRRRRV